MTELIYPNFPKELIKSQIDLDRYVRFIDSRPIRKHSKELYTERHHKAPKSLGGSNDKSNMIRLTGREHFIAHLILWKALEKGMTTAFFYMCNNKRKHSFQISSRMYAELREEAISHSKTYSGWAKGKKFSEEEKVRMYGSRRGMTTPEETKKKMSEARKGYTISEETKTKISKTLTGVKQGLTSEDTKAKMSAARKKYWANKKDRALSEDHKKKISEGLKRRKEELLNK